MKNLNCCCYCNNLCRYDPMNYIRFKNFIDLRVKCILQYSVFDDTVTKEVVLNKGEFKRYNLPGVASNICLNILNISSPMTKLIYHDCVSGNENILYEIYNTPENPLCMKIILIN
ncbi:MULTISPECIES: hypothetical protein [Clostridium]|nr:MULTISPECIES: hypothetical protein [Clostridium]